jgi:hypothetical protein
MKRAIVLALILMGPLVLTAQDDLMDLLGDPADQDVSFATATFKSTRIMNGHSIERMAPGQLDFRISHRFGRINSGAYEFWGLDQANIRLGLEYGITKWLMVGVGRGTYEKTFDGFAKFSVLRQSAGAKEMPVSLSVFTSAAIRSLKWPDENRENYFSSRLSYVGQVLIARKFSQSLSFQLTPSYVHRNLVSTELDDNDLWSIGAGGRVKLTKRISFNAEYYYLLNPTDYFSQAVYNPLSLGFDVETGGHVFQIIVTNSVAMIEKGFIGETTGQWSNGDIHLGFNISRVFNLSRKKEKDQ